MGGCPVAGGTMQFDCATDRWAGVVPVTVRFGEPEPDATLRPGIAVPEHIRHRG